MDSSKLMCSFSHTTDTTQPNFPPLPGSPLPYQLARSKEVDTHTQTQDTGTHTDTHTDTDTQDTQTQTQTDTHTQTHRDTQRHADRHRRRHRHTQIY